jgi:hypothetical protein
MKILLAATLAALATAPAFADRPLVIDFDAPPSFASVASFYDGVGGPALGISFGPDALALQTDELGPYFSNAPSPQGVMTPVGAAATMNVPLGFTGSIVFSYSSADLLLGGVKVWSGLDGSGRLLAVFSLLGNAQDGCSDSPFCRFDRVSSTFRGLARSVSFGDAANVAAFDDIAITAVPEPASALLMALGVAGLLAARRLGA